MPAKERFGLGALREAALELADRTSIRSAAGEIGLSYTALRWFLRGGTPQQRSLKILVEWYASARGGPEHLMDLQSALALLSDHLLGAASDSVASARIREVAAGLASGLTNEKRQLLADALSSFRSDSLDSSHGSSPQSSSRPSGKEAPRKRKA